MRMYWRQQHSQIYRRTSLSWHGTGMRLLLKNDTVSYLVAPPLQIYEGICYPPLPVVTRCYPVVTQLLPVHLSPEGRRVRVSTGRAAKPAGLPVLMPKHSRRPSSSSLHLRSFFRTLLEIGKARKRTPGNNSSWRIRKRKPLSWSSQTKIKLMFSVFSTLSQSSTSKDRLLPTSYARDLIPPPHLPLTRRPLPIPHQPFHSLIVSRRPMSRILQYIQNLRRMVKAVVSKLHIRKRTNTLPSNGPLFSPSRSLQSIPLTLTSSTTTYDLGMPLETGELPSRPQTNLTLQDWMKLNSSSPDSTFVSLSSTKAIVFGSTTTNNDESTTLHEDDISDDNLTFFPYVRGKDNVVAFDLPDPYVLQDDFAFPDIFKFIPLAQKRLKVSALRPHPQATPLRPHHHRPFPSSSNSHSGTTLS